MANFKRALPRQAESYHVPNAKKALEYLRDSFPNTEFNVGAGDRIIVSLTGSYFHDMLVEKEILEKLGGVRA